MYRFMAGSDVKKPSDIPLAFSEDDKKSSLFGVVI